MHIMKLSTQRTEPSLPVLGFSTHPRLQHECRGDPGLTGDPGTVGNVVPDQFGNEGAKVHVRGEDHDDLGRGLNYSLDDVLDVLWRIHLTMTGVEF